MLHGYLSDKESFSYQINVFSRYMRVVAVDMTGFGKSVGMKTPYSLDDYVAEIGRVIDELGVKKVNVLAHSFGARVAVKLANKDARINKIIFTGAAGLKPRRGIKYILKKAAFNILKKFVDKSRLRSFYSPDYLALSGVMRESFIKIINEPLDEEYKKLKNPAIIICGDKDRETPLSAEKRMKKLIGCDLYVLPSTGHFCFTEKPDEFNGIALSFLFGR